MQRWTLTRMDSQSFTQVPMIFVLWVSEKEFPNNESPKLIKKSEVNISIGFDLEQCLE